MAYARAYAFSLMALIIFAVYGLNNRNQTVLLELDQADIDGRLFMQEMATGQALSEERQNLHRRFCRADSGSGSTENGPG